MSTQPHAVLGSVTFQYDVPSAPDPQPRMADVLAALLRLEGKVDKLLQAQAQAPKPAAGGYKTL